MTTSPSLELENSVCGGEAHTSTAYSVYRSYFARYTCAHTVRTLFFSRCLQHAGSSVLQHAHIDEDYDSSESVSKDEVLGLELEDGVSDQSSESYSDVDKDSSAEGLVRTDAYGEPIGKSASEFTDAVNLVSSCRKISIFVYAVFFFQR